MDQNTLSQLFETYKEASLQGRYIHNEHILPLLKQLENKVTIRHLGVSENEEPIHLIKIGHGSKDLLFWSQMHGNESTTTKAIFDLLNMLIDGSHPIAKSILDNCTLYIIPILNPDGAKLYTRPNYNKIDLNRDAQNLTQKESVILNKMIKEIKPLVGFNLHGQRTIFGAGDTKYPATVSFLSAAGDEERNVTSSRKIAMGIIAKINQTLQKFIPNQIGRYDDGFNINCVGDTLAANDIPAILFEAGHHGNDYSREVCRSLIFNALVTAVHYIATQPSSELNVNYEDYFLIPENKKSFHDIIIRDVILAGENVDIAIQYQETLIDNTLKFIPIVAKIEDLSNFFGHREIVGNKREIRNENLKVQLVPEVELLKFYLDSELFSTDLIKT